MSYTKADSFSEKGKRAITTACQFAAAFCLLASLMLFIGWVRFQTQEPPIAAIDRASDIPWWACLAYLSYAAALYALPKAMRHFDNKRNQKMAGN